MNTIDEILALSSIEDKVDALKKKDVDPSKWSDLVSQYDPMKHEIITDTTTRKDKTFKDGTIEKVARVTYGQQRMFARRMTQMAFAIPVKREYNTSTDEERAIATAIENVYKKTRIDSINVNRMHAYFAACEVMTIWYAVKATNNDYGFNSEYKLRCTSYSPMDRKFSRIEQADIYPFFIDGDMVALSFSYQKKGKDKTVNYFETYTQDKHIVWANEDSWIEKINEDIKILKIPGIYIWRPMPIWEDTTNNTKEIEYTMSRQSDILRRNSAPP